MYQQRKLRCMIFLTFLMHPSASDFLSFNEESPSGGSLSLLALSPFSHLLNSLRKLICLFPNKHSFCLMLGNISRCFTAYLLPCSKPLHPYLSHSQARCCLTHQMCFNEFCVSSKKILTVYICIQK